MRRPVVPSLQTQTLKDGGPVTDVDTIHSLSQENWSLLRLVDELRRQIKWLDGELDRVQRLMLTRLDNDTDDDLDEWADSHRVHRHGEPVR